MIALIILAILLIVAGTGAGIAYNHMKRVSKEVFGTSDIGQVAQQLKVEAATTPKSVSAMTSLLLPKIENDFPDFEYDEMKEKVENTLTSYLQAISAKNIGLLQEGNSELRGELETLIHDLKYTEKSENWNQIRIHRTELYQYTKKAGRCIITFQSSLEAFHFVKDKDGNVIAGDANYKYQTRFNTDLIYIQDRDLVENTLDEALAMNCTNCGAPLVSLGAKKCAYCDSPLLEYNIHVWSISNIKES